MPPHMQFSCCDASMRGGAGPRHDGHQSPAPPHTPHSKRLTCITGAGWTLRTFMTGGVTVNALAAPNKAVKRTRDIMFIFSAMQGEHGVAG